jgi:pyridoxamine 5'-phosphate oxidase
MNFKDCIEFATAIHNCYLATADGNQPHVRVFGLWFADDTGFYFQTESVKAVYQQLKKNNKVELCFYGKTKDSTENKVMRVTGEIEFINDMALKKQVLELRTSLKSYGIDKPEDPRLIVFRVNKGEAFFWTNANNMKEAEIERIKFGPR